MSTLCYLLLSFFASLSVLTTPTSASSEVCFPVYKNADEQHCLPAFPDLLMNQWNKVRVSEQRHKFEHDSDLASFGQEAARNMSVGKSVILEDLHLGLLNFTMSKSSVVQSICVNPEEIVTEEKDQVPLRVGDIKFTKEEWSATKLFGVGCSAYVADEKTNLFIQLVWYVPF